MTNKNQMRLKRAATAMALLGAAAALSGCGRNNDNNGQVVGGLNGTLTNPYGFNPNQPFGNANGCLPVTSGAIPFVAANIYMSSAAIAGGTVPVYGGSTYQIFGQVQVGGTPVQGQYTYQSASGNRFTIALPQWNSGFSYGTYGAQAQGTLYLSAAAIQSIMQITSGGYSGGYSYGGYYGGSFYGGGTSPAMPMSGYGSYPGFSNNSMMGTGPCVVGIGFNYGAGGYYGGMPGNTLSYGTTYLYLNTMQTPLTIN